MFKGEILHKTKGIVCFFTFLLGGIFLLYASLIVSTVCMLFCIFYNTVAGFVTVEAYFSVFFV